MEIFYFNADEPKQIKALSKLATDILRVLRPTPRHRSKSLHDRKFQSVHGILDHMKRGAVYGVLTLTPIQSVEDIANALGFLPMNLKKTISISVNFICVLMQGAKDTVTP